MKDGSLNMVTDQLKPLVDAIGDTRREVAQVGKICAYSPVSYRFLSLSG